MLSIAADKKLLRGKTVLGGKHDAGDKPGDEGDCAQGTDIIVLSQCTIFHETQRVLSKTWTPACKILEV